MFKKNTLALSILTVTLATGLTACGGGSSGSGGGSLSDVSSNVKTGRLVDSAVAGIEYETSAGNTGVTNDNGEFLYKEGDTVTFRVGSLNFGTVYAGQLITPKDLAGGDSDKAVNIARVLQTLDDDGIPDNGITITEDARGKAENQNPIDVATADLNASKDIILEVAINNTVTPVDLVSEEAAEEHLNETLVAENPITSCGENTTPVSEQHLLGRTFGFIRNEKGDKEVGLMNFDNSGSLIEYLNDNGDVQEGSDTKWSVSGGGALTLTTTDEVENFTGCVVGPEDNPYYLILGDEPILYSVKTFAESQSSQSYLLTSIDHDLNENDHDIMTVDSELAVEFISDNGFDEASVEVDGALGVNDYKVYLLSAQGKRIGIYLKSGVDNNLQDVGIATNIPAATRMTAESLSGQTLVWRNEDDNETVIMYFNENGSGYEYYNDYYNDDEREAGLERRSWRIDDVTGKLLLEQTNEDGYSDTEAYGIFESDKTVYMADDTVYYLSKVQAINSQEFPGTYNVNIPTENTVNNTLVISDGDCTYAGTACTWSIGDSGKATLNFGAGETATAEIWQLAGSTSDFAFVITHSDDETDVEVGFMTRQ